MCPDWNLSWFCVGGDYSLFSRSTSITGQSNMLTLTSACTYLTVKYPIFHVASACPGWTCWWEVGLVCRMYCALTAFCKSSIWIPCGYKLNLRWQGLVLCMLKVFLHVLTEWVHQHYGDFNSVLLVKCLANQHVLCICWNLNLHIFDLGLP